MTDWFGAPERLWAFTAVAALVVAAALAARRRRRDQVRFSNVALFDKIAPQRPGWRRWIPAGFLLVALSSLVVAFAEPMRTTAADVEQATIVVAFDTSLSMGATDVTPDRLTAAQDGAQSMLAALPKDVNVAIVGFAGTAAVLSPPSTDRAATAATIDNLTLAQSTAIGDAIDTSVALLESRDLTGDTAKIVVLSDGGTTVGVPSADAAQRAQERGYAVSTIAYGTPDGTVHIDGDGDGTEEDVPVPVNVEELAEIAEITGGQALTAETAAEIADAFNDIGSSVGTEERREPVSWVFSGIAFAALVAAAGTSLWWLGRLI